MPTATSAPSSPGERSWVSASRSAATTTTAPADFAAAMAPAGSQTRPEAPGYCTNRPKASVSSGASAGVAARSRTTSSMPTASARLRSRASVCGKVSASTTNREEAALEARRASSIPSTTAVPSSSIDALAVSSPVRSATMVWKLISASRRPCEISGWYGVYAVYQPGFSSTLRLITAGVIVP